MDVVAGGTKIFEDLDTERAKRRHFPLPPTGINRALPEGAGS